MSGKTKTTQKSQPGAPTLSAAAITALIAAHGAASSQAQNAPASGSSTNQATTLPEVTVSGQQANESFKPEAVASPKYTEPLLDVPQTITVIPRAVYESQGATTLRDILRNVPGISMQAGEGGGGLPGDNLSIRGFNARADMFVDGVRDYGAYSRDPFNIEQVEVAKGPTSATAGRGSTGGSVNLVSKVPQLRRFYEGSVGFGTDDYKRATLDLNQPLTDVGMETSAIRLNGMWQDSDTPGRDVVDNTRWGFAPSLAFGLGTPTRLTLGYMHMTQENTPDYGIPWVPAGNIDPVLSGYENLAPPVDFDNFYGIKGYDFEDIRTDIATATLEHDFSESLRLRNLTRYGRTHRDSAITAPRFADIDPVTAGSQTTTVLNRQLQRREITSEIFANQSDLRFDFDTGPVSHELVGGLEIAQENQDNANSAQTANQPQTDIYNPNPNDIPLGPMPNITGVPNEANALTVAPYVFDTIKVHEKVSLNGGLRWDRVDAEYTSGGASFERVDEMLSWRAGAVYKPLPNGSIYFGYGTSFNPSIDGNVGMALAANNASLDPEETGTYELGTKWDLFQQRLSLTAAVFHTTKDNARTPGVNPGDPPLVLDGEQEVQGFELGAAGSITEEWKVFAGYTFMDTEIKVSNTAGETGSEFSNAPDHSVSLWTTYALPFNVEVGLGANYVGDRKNGNAATARIAPDYWLFDSMVSYRVNDHVSLRLNVYNLADERYIDRVGGGHFIPGTGRAAILTASLRF